MIVGGEEPRGDKHDFSRLSAKYYPTVYMDAAYQQRDDHVFCFNVLGENFITNSSLSGLILEWADGAFRRLGVYMLITQGEIDPYEAEGMRRLVSMMTSRESIDECLPCEYFDTASREHVIKIT